LIINKKKIVKIL